MNYIGLIQMAKMPHSDVTVEFSKSCSDEAKFIHMKNPIRFLQTDPDLAEIPIPSHDVTTYLFFSGLGHLRGHKHLWLKGTSAGGARLIDAHVRERTGSVDPVANASTA